MNWFYVQDDGASKAEVDEAQFSLRVAQGLIKRETLVWREGQADWMPSAQARPDLFSALPTAPPAPMSPQPGYYQPAPGMPPPMVMVITPPTDQMALISMISGIVSLVSLLACPGVGFFIGLPAVICGHMSKKKIAQSQGQLSGDGMALTGLITGYLGIAISALIVLVFGAMIGVAAMSSPTISSPP